MVSWLVIVLDVGGSVILLSSYTHHMSLHASRAPHLNRVVRIMPELISLVNRLTNNFLPPTTSLYYITRLELSPR